MKILKTVIIVSVLALSVSINVARAEIVSIEYSGTVNSLVDTGSYSSVNIGEQVSGNLIFDTRDLFSIEGDAAKKDYIYTGSGTSGSLSTINNGVMGSNTAYVGIENDLIDDFGSVYDIYYMGGFSDDLVWDQLLDRPISGTQFALLFVFNSNAFNSTDLDFETLLNTPDSLLTEILIDRYDAAGQLYEAKASLDTISYSITAVPVPATIWLFGSGLLGLLGMAKRKTHAPFACP